MIFRCHHCGRPIGKGKARGGDWCICAACQEGLRQAGVLKRTNTTRVQQDIKKQLRRPGNA